MCPNKLDLLFALRNIMILDHETNIAMGSICRYSFGLDGLNFEVCPGHHLGSVTMPVFVFMF